MLEIKCLIQLCSSALVQCFLQQMNSNWATNVRGFLFDIINTTTCISFFTYENYFTKLNVSNNKQFPLVIQNPLRKMEENEITWLCLMFTLKETDKWTPQWWLPFGSWRGAVSAAHTHLESPTEAPLHAPQGRSSNSNLWGTSMHASSIFSLSSFPYPPLHCTLSTTQEQGILVEKEVEAEAYILVPTNKRCRFLFLWPTTAAPSLSLSYFCLLVLGVWAPASLLQPVIPTTDAGHLPARNVKMQEGDRRNGHHFGKHQFGMTTKASHKLWTGEQGK